MRIAPTIIFSVSCLTPALFALPVQAACSAKETKIILAISPGETSDAALKHALALESGFGKTLKGRACIQIEKGSLRETVLAGKAHMAVPSFSELARDIPQYGVFDVPFIFRNTFSWQKFDANREVLGKQLATRKLTGLYRRFDGFEQIAGKVDFLKPSNATGLRFRKPDHTSGLIELLAATTTEISKGELPAALKDGRIDAHFATWTAMGDAKSFNEQKVVTRTNHRLLGGQIVVSTDWWLRLSANLRTDIGKALVNITTRHNASLSASIRSNKDIAIRTAPVLVPTRKQRDKWLALAAPIRNQFRKVDGSAELLDLIAKANK